MITRPTNKGKTEQQANIVDEATLGRAAWSVTELEGNVS